MFCSKCGKENSNEVKFCAHCGTAIGSAQNTISKPKKNLGMAMLLALLFNSLGLFYATVNGGVVMTFLNFFAALIFYRAYANIASNIYNAGLDIHVLNAMSAQTVTVTIAMYVTFIGLYLASVIWAYVAATVEYTEES